MDVRVGKQSLCDLYILTEYCTGGSISKMPYEGIDGDQEVHKGKDGLPRRDGRLTPGQESQRCKTFGQVRGWREASQEDTL